MELDLALRLSVYAVRRFGWISFGDSIRLNVKATSEMVQLMSLNFFDDNRGKAIESKINLKKLKSRLIEFLKSDDSYAESVKRSFLDERGELKADVSSIGRFAFVIFKLINQGSFEGKQEHFGEIGTFAYERFTVKKVKLFKSEHGILSKVYYLQNKEGHLLSWFPMVGEYDPNWLVGESHKMKFAVAEHRFYKSRYITKVVLMENGFTTCSCGKEKRLNSCTGDFICVDSNCVWN